MDKYWGELRMRPAAELGVRSEGVVLTGKVSVQEAMQRSEFEVRREGGGPGGGGARRHPEKGG